MYKLALASPFFSFSLDHFSSERKTCSLILLGKIDEAIAIDPPTKKMMPDSRSSKKGKKSFLTGARKLISLSNNQVSKSPKSIPKTMRLTFKAQTMDFRQPLGILIIIKLQKKGSFISFFFPQNRM